MKLAALITIFGLVATAAANPIPEAEPAQLEGRVPPGFLIAKNTLPPPFALHGT